MTTPRLTHSLAAATSYHCYSTARPRPAVTLQHHAVTDHSTTALSCRWSTAPSHCQYCTTLSLPPRLHTRLLPQHCHCLDHSGTTPRPHFCCDHTVAAQHCTATRLVLHTTSTTSPLPPRPHPLSVPAPRPLHDHITRSVPPWCAWLRAWWQGQVCFTDSVTVTTAAQWCSNCCGRDGSAVPLRSDHTMTSAAHND